MNALFTVLWRIFTLELAVRLWASRWPLATPLASRSFADALAFLGMGAIQPANWITALCCTFGTTIVRTPMRFRADSAAVWLITLQLAARKIH
jgi:hypothetical protein